MLLADNTQNDNVAGNENQATLTPLALLSPSLRNKKSIWKSSLVCTRGSTNLEMEIEIENFDLIVVYLAREFFAEEKPNRTPAKEEIKRELCS